MKSRRKIMKEVEVNKKWKIAKPKTKVGKKATCKDKKNKISDVIIRK